MARRTGTRGEVLRIAEEAKKPKNTVREALLLHLADGKPQLRSAVVDTICGELELDAANGERRKVIDEALVLDSQGWLLRRHTGARETWQILDGGPEE